MSDEPSSADMFPIEVGAVERLRARLAREAEAGGVLDVAYRTVASPVGELLVAATDRGLVRVAFQREGFDHVLDVIANRISPRILEAPRRVDDVVRELEEYFAGRRRTFDLPLDHRMSAGFRQLVQRSLPTIAYGHTATYKEIAALVGNPRAVRAVGSACATNPLPLVVPCHRVLRSDGTIGRYAGGDEAKATLLALERAA